MTYKVSSGTLNLCSLTARVRERIGVRARVSFEAELSVNHTAYIPVEILQKVPL